MKKLKCHCGEEIKNPFSGLTDLDKDPDAFSRIKEGAFQVITCKKCGAELKPEFPFRIKQKSKGIDIYFVPELDRLKYYQNNLEYSLPATDRVVIGYPELVEKLKIFIEYKLDDRIIEAIKYYMLSKIYSREENEADQDRNIVQIYLRKKINNQIEFYIDGLKDDELGLFKMDMSVYKSMENSLKDKYTEEPFSEFLTPPYISINILTKES